LAQRRWDLLPGRNSNSTAGVKVDVTVQPTLAGIRKGRDQVIEEAIHLIDPDLTAEKIKQLVPNISRSY
jgi:hypothetical protein